ncbi:MAG: metallophosphoesterase [Deltaproteobacteria bacterium]|uniref:metallophosphoesterase n=1 Tax=Desulfobacula sp. TaxID=2593537 RepID=UPI00199B5C3F|nr:metallophosphoesterase [Candidatus Desulfobacula maris]MBL6993820.1 metallophosphoesterase [Desulfobacula sp.]
MKKVKYIIISLLVVIFVYGRYIEPNTIQIREIKINCDFIGKALKDKTIVHLSDLHMSRLGKVETGVLKSIEQINPDLIFLTGDYVRWKGDTQPALQFLSRLKAKYGVFAVMGDYDYSDSKNSCLFCHKKGSGRPTKQHNVTMLRNSLQKIHISDQVVKIAGIDEEYDDLNEFEEIEDMVDQDAPLLVLSHSPFVFDKFSGKDRVFLFSGDTHGGQVRLPLWLYKLFGYEKNVKYNYGLFQEGNKIMYVTRGIGTSHFRFRLFSQPEIVVFRF